MPLHLESFGSGPELVLLHGWGLHGGLWHPVLPFLATNFCVHVLDLPGHGLSAFDQTLELSDVAAQLHDYFPRPVTVVAWSLGGLFALEWAKRFPAAVEKLVLVSSSPCFRQRPDWLPAMETVTLEAFAASLRNDYRGTLKRFLNLQLMGDDAARTMGREMQAKLFERGEPDPAALERGLDILRDVDWRPFLSQIHQSTLLLYGARDRLVPIAAAQWLLAHLPAARLHVFDNAAHAPHWSHPIEFVEAVKAFIYE